MTIRDFALYMIAHDYWPPFIIAADPDEDTAVDYPPDPPKCTDCKGSGGVSCPDCKGSGEYVGATVRETCKRCKGARKDLCETCDGSGY